MINGAAAHSTLFFSFLSGSLEWAGRRKEERVDALGGSKEMNEWMNKEKRMKFFLICEWAVSFVWCLMDLISFLWLLWVMAGLPAMLRNKRRKQKEIKFKSNQLAAFMKFIWLMGFFLLVGYGRCQRQGLRQKRENSPINQINEMNKARRIKERMEWIFGMKWIVWMEWKQWMPMEKMNGMVHQAAPAARQAPQQINNSFSMEIELWLCWWRRTWGRRPT